LKNRLRDLLSKPEVMTLINQAIDSFPRKEFPTCECYLGFVTQLEMLSDESSQQFLEIHKPERDQIHSCLGCDPCPPGDQYAEFLRGNIKI
jgi:hypothetical protein